jgi:tripartite ATP-independent transporter DctM subunit
VIFLLFGLLALFLVLGLPVAVALFGSAMIYVMVADIAPPMVLTQRMVAGVDSFTLLAVPCFILAGNLMNGTGITLRIFDFATAAMGWMRGGLGHVNIGASVIFSGMSGSAAADAGGLGTIEIEAMRARGYDMDFAIGVTAASSTIGPIIPPSLPLIVYGVLSSTSIGALFLAGILPGLVMAALLMVMVAIVARRRGYGPDATFSLRALFRTGAAAFLALLTPVIIVGGIMLGVFTATEASIVAVFYAGILGLFVYRTLDLRGLGRVLFDTVETTAVILLVVAAASAFAWVLTAERVRQMGADLLLSVTDRTWLILILINLLLLVVGLFLEPVAAITILVPVLLPVAREIGLDPVQLGVMMVLNLMIGLMTPPVGVILFILARITKQPVMAVARASLPFMIPLGLALLAVTFVPALTLFIPRLLGP